MSLTETLEELEKDEGTTKKEHPDEDMQYLLKEKYDTEIESEA